MADTSETKITATLTASPIKRTGRKGQTIASLTVKRPENESDTTENIALSGEYADKFFADFEETAANMGEEQENFRPTVTFEGNWSSSEWTNKQNKTITSWTFWAKTSEF